jgi:hypothetical protein
MNVATTRTTATRFRSLARPIGAALVMFATLPGIVCRPTVRADETAPAAPTETAAREQRVIAFVERHQPELAALLSRLAKRKPDEYAAAVADLDRKVLALEADRSKDERLYEAGLRAWQARTQADLLVARWIAGGKKDRAKIEPQLRAAIDAELDARAEHLEIRKQRSAAWYDRQIVRLRDKRDEAVASRMNDLLGPQEKKPKPSAARP